MLSQGKITSKHVKTADLNWVGSFSYCWSKNLHRVWCQKKKKIWSLEHQFWWILSASRHGQTSDESYQHSGLPGQRWFLPSKGKSPRASCLERCTKLPGLKGLGTRPLPPATGNSHMRGVREGRLEESWRQDGARFSKFPNRVSQIRALHGEMESHGWLWSQN